MQKKSNEGCEVRTRADNCPADLKSAALDHSANPPYINAHNFVIENTNLNTWLG